MPHQAFDHSNYGFYSNQISQQSLATSRYFPLELNQGQNLYKRCCHYNKVCPCQYDETFFHIHRILGDKDQNNQDYQCF